MKRFLSVFIFAFCYYDAASQSLDTLRMQGAQQRVYKTVDSIQLRMYLFYPENKSAIQNLPVIVFFFGGAWVNGEVKQFEQQCRYFSSQGMLAVAVDYRVRSRHRTTPFESARDAKSAIRYLRRNAKELSIEENKIVAAGGSAGGHLAAATAFIEQVNEVGEDSCVSAIPNALVLYNPALDLSGLQQRNATTPLTANWRLKAQDISPLHHVGEKAPPTIIFHGTADTTVAFSQAIRFCDVMKAKRNSCDVVPYEGQYHGFFNFGRPEYYDCLQKTAMFLKEKGFLKEQN